MVAVRPVLLYSKREMTVIELSDEQAAEEGITLEAWLQKLAAVDTPVRTRKRSRYTLAELMSRCDLSAPLSDEDRAC